MMSEESVNVDQEIWARISGCGTTTIIGTGGNFVLTNRNRFHINDSEKKRQFPSISNK
jgi:hypothetical protein